MTTAVEVGLCECGCGGTPAIAQKTNVSRGWVRGEPVRFVRGHNSKGETNPKWKGGRLLDRGQYVIVLHPSHPHADRHGYVREHIMLAVAALGKALPRDAVVHHVDGNPQHNVNSNLVVCENQGYHMLLEYRTRALHACGDANAMKCHLCKQWDDVANLYVPPRRRLGRRICHRRCRREYELEYNRRRRGR